MAAASLWPPPPPPPRALASIRLQVTRWQNRFFQTFGRAKADYANCRTKKHWDFESKERKDASSSSGLVRVLNVVYQTNWQALKTSFGVTWLCLNSC